MRRSQASEEKRSHPTLCRIRHLSKRDQRVHRGKTGKVIREVKVATKPVAILAVLTEQALAIERIGLEAGPLSQWLYSALVEADLPVICVETRHMKAALSAQINKSDRNDARGIAQMMRVGLYRPVHVKTLAETALVRPRAMRQVCRQLRATWSRPRSPTIPSGTQVRQSFDVQDSRPLVSQTFGAEVGKSHRPDSHRK